MIVESNQPADRTAAPLEVVDAAIAATDRAPPKPADAIAALSPSSPGADDSADPASDSAPAAEKSTPKRKGGWPKGKPRKKAARASSPATDRKATKGASKQPTRAELQEQLDRALEQLAERDADAPGPRVDPIEEASKTIAGSLLALGSMLEGGPYRAFILDEEEADSLGQIWGPVAGPHWEQIAERAPIAIAIAMTGRVFYPKWKRFRDDQTRAAIDVMPGLVDPNEEAPANA